MGRGMFLILIHMLNHSLGAHGFHILTVKKTLRTANEPARKFRRPSCQLLVIRIRPVPNFRVGTSLLGCPTGT